MNRPPLPCHGSALPDELWPRHPGGTRTHDLRRVMPTFLPLNYRMLAGLSRQSARRLCRRTLLFLLPLLPLVAVLLPPARPAHVVHTGKLRSKLTVLTHRAPPFCSKGEATEGDELPCDCTSRFCLSGSRCGSRTHRSPGYGPGKPPLLHFCGSGRRI